MRILLIILMLSCEPEVIEVQKIQADSVQVGPPGNPNIDPDLN